MWQQHEVVNRLVDIIQQLQSQYETGQLTARHGSGSTMEEGTIVFVRGKISEVRLGRRSGSEALNRLSSWERCVCWFTRAGDSAGSSGPTTDKLRQSGNTPLPFSSSSSGSLPYTDPTGQFIRASQPGVPSTPGVPYALSRPQLALQRIEQLGLSRTHRRLFLLIDGHRSLPDLARLMGKNADEVQQLLQDLVQGAVIRISDEPRFYTI